MTGQKQYQSTIKRFKAKRVRLGLSLRQLERKIGVNFSTLHRFELGEEISATTYLKLAAFVERNGVRK